MPPEHYLVLLRLVFFVNVGGVAMREIYDFMDDPSVPELSLQTLGRVASSCRNRASCDFSQQEVPQKAGPAGVAGVGHNGDGVPHRGQVRPPHPHAAHPLLRHAVLVLGHLPHPHLDSVEVLHPVRRESSLFSSRSTLKNVCLDVFGFLGVLRASSRGFLDKTARRGIKLRRYKITRLIKFIFQIKKSCKLF